VLTSSCSGQISGRKGLDRMEPLSQYERVRLVTDAFEAEGAQRGMVGYIIEVYNNDAFEVEFSSPSGVTIAQVVAVASDLERHPEASP
jgi:hypothetical protein